MKATVIITHVLCAALAIGLQAQDVLIKGGHVIPISGPELERGDVLVRNGRIAAVGVDLEVDPSVRVLPAAGRVVMPGFILAETSRGMDRENEVVDVVPFVHVRDSIDPVQLFFEDSLRDGHLTMLVLPGDNTVVGGMGMALHPYGLTVEAMTVLPDAGLKLSLVPARGNRATHLAKLRRALEAAKATLVRLETDGELEQAELTGNWDVDLDAMQVQRRDQALIRLLKGEIPAFIACQTAGDVVNAVKLAEEFGLDARLTCGPGTWRAAGFLAEKKVPVILGPVLTIEETDPETGEKVRRVIPRIFSDAGVDFAVTSSPSGLGSRYLWYQAAALVREGLDRSAALRAVTLRPAEILDLAERIGSLEPGKDADILLLTADPLSGRAWVDQALLAGRVVYERDKDPRLAEVLRDTPR